MIPHYQRVLMIICVSLAFAGLSFVGGIHVQSRLLQSAVEAIALSSPQLEKELSLIGQSESTETLRALASGSLRRQEGIADLVLSICSNIELLSALLAVALLVLFVVLSVLCLRLTSQKAPQGPNPEA
jgi:hypothetical protein